MSSVWKRLQRVNKRAAKFQFTASFHELQVETKPTFRPNNLYIVWTRRSRRVVSTPVTFEPDLENPLTASMCWAVPDNHTITVTLFRDARTRELEDKDWTLAIEDVSRLHCTRTRTHLSLERKLERQPLVIRIFLNKSIFLS